jgi:hypothetical protein
VNFTRLLRASYTSGALLPEAKVIDFVIANSELFSFLKSDHWLQRTVHLNVTLCIEKIVTARETSLNFVLRLRALEASGALSPETKVLDFVIAIIKPFSDLKLDHRLRRKSFKRF